MRSRALRAVSIVATLLACLTAAGLPSSAWADGQPGTTRAAPAPANGTLALPSPAHVSAAGTAPNIFFYNLDDLRDMVPGDAVDPMRFMPKLRAWMADGRRYTQMFVADPVCCPSRASLMTGRYPHNNGVKQQAQGPDFDFPHSVGCYLQAAGYATYLSGKFLTTWPKTKQPPCYDHSSVIWGGYNDAAAKQDGVPVKKTGYSTTYLGIRGRGYITSALASDKPFYLYEAPQAPHWGHVTLPDGEPDHLAIPEPKYASAPIGPCYGTREADRSDKPAYIRRTNETIESAQRMCESQLRAIMSADDEFDATMQLLADRGALAHTLVIFSSDNGYNWGEHGRTEKFVPYEPSIRVPLYVRWPGHVAAGTDTSRLTSYLDLMPTILAAAQTTVPAGAPALDGESLLEPSSRTTMFSEYYRDPANGNMNTWKAVRTSSAKYIETYNEAGGVVFREYYDLLGDPNELTNLLTDGHPDTPPPAQVSALATSLAHFTACEGPGCLR